MPAGLSDWAAIARFSLWVQQNKMNTACEESKGACQRCGEHIAFPSVMQGRKVACPHCGLETPLVTEDVQPSKPLLLDPDWQKRIPNTAIGLLVKTLGTFIELIIGLLMLVAIAAAFVIFLRCLHAAWGR
jgi:hypothetical protein